MPEISFEEARLIVRGFNPASPSPHAEAALRSRYPFLAVSDGRKADGVGVLSSIPTGWRRAFAAELVEDIRTVLLACGGEDALDAYEVFKVI